MIPETRWERLKELLESAIAVSPDKRAAFLDGQCGGDAALRQELASLVGAHEEAGDFLSGSVLQTPPLPPGDAESLVGRRLGPYRVLGLIGRGGMGAVYRAARDDDHFQKVVALKVARHEVEGALAPGRFRSERQILAGLEHPGIARLLDGGSTEEGRPFFVMEHVEGTRIDAWAEERQLDLRGRLELFQQVCAVVHYAHAQRVVHRDLKPANILVTGEGAPKLLDFGIAKLLDPAGTGETTASAAAPMTPEYASPEQLRGQPVGTASDVYSLGVVLYELLAGQRPHRLSGRGPVELARVLLHEQPPRPSEAVTEAMARGARATVTRLRGALEGDLDTIVLKALRKEPERRYASAAALAEDVRRHLAGLPVLARPDTLGYRAGKFVQRHRATLGWTALVACVAGAGVAVVDRARWGRAARTGSPASLTGTPRQAAAQPYRIVPFTSLAGREKNPAFSPDGTLLAYEWSSDQRLPDVYVQAAAGGQPRGLTAHRDAECCPSFSPDGRQVAFLRFNRGGADLVTVPVEGGSERHVTRVNLGDALGLAWSPDGRLAVVEAGPPPAAASIFAISPGGQRQRLTSPQDGEADTYPRFSPDGSTLAFLRQKRVIGKSLFVVSLRGASTPRPLAPGDWQPTDLAWTPDGRALVFSSARAGHEGIWRVDLEGGAPEPLRLAGGLGRSSLAVALQGHRLAYTAPSTDINLWRRETRPGGGPPVRWVASTRNDAAPQYSADGRRIAFQSDRSGSHEIWVCDADGGDPVRVTSFGGPHTGSPRWSPDGQRIAFDSYPQGGGDVFVVDLRGGAPRPVVEGPDNDVVPAWSQDGAWLYFASDRDGGWRIWKVPSGGGPATPVTERGGFAPAVSRDGRFLYFFNRQKGGVWRVPTAGGPETLVDKTPARWGTWTLAADGLYGVTEQGQPPRFFIDFLHFASGKRRRVAALARPVDLWALSLTVSPDGQHVLYTQYDRRESDIMLVDNFQ